METFEKYKIFMKANTHVFSTFVFAYYYSILPIKIHFKFLFAYYYSILKIHFK